VIEELAGGVPAVKKNERSETGLDDGHLQVNRTAPASTPGWMSRKI
jgi:hypothetical protein